MKTGKRLAAVLSAAVTLTALCGTIPAAGVAEGVQTLDRTGYHQVWADEFNGDALNRNDWNVELHDPGWVNSELQAYVDSDENIQVHDGNLYLIPVAHTEAAEAGTNLLANADFANGLNGWTETIANWDASVTADAQSAISGGTITYTIANPGTEDWHIQLKQENVSLMAGVTYRASFTATSTTDRSIRTSVMSATYAGYGGTDAALTANVPQTVSFDFTMAAADSTAQFQISMGLVTPDTTPGSVTLSDLSVVALGDAVVTETTYTSGRINTQNKNTFTYGLFECRAKVPEGKGYLPAFWLMANDENIYGQWPRCGEIDCMEVMGQDTHKLYGTIHFGNPHSESQGTHILSGSDSYSDDFHVFACEWVPGEIRWYMDGVLYHSESDWYSTTEGQGTISYPAPFDQSFYIILNLAVGGSWVGNPDENTNFDDNPYVIDYVRVSQKDEYDENVTRPEKPFNPSDPDDEGNYIRNGSFATAEALFDDNVDWQFMLANEGVADAVIANNMLTITTESAGNVDYSVQLVQAGLPFQKGATYEVKFDARAEGNRTMNVDVKAPDHGYKSYMPTKNPALTSQMQTFTYTFVMKDDSDTNGRLEFNMGAGATDTIQLTNVSVKKIADPDPNAKEQKTVLANGSYIYNGSFQEGANHLGYWTLSDPDAASVTGFSDGRRLKVTAPLTLSQDELAFPEGVPYALSFEAQGEGSLTVTLGGRQFTAALTGQKQTFTFKLSAGVHYTDKTLSIVFPGTGTAWLDNVKLVEDALIKNGSFNDGLTGYEVYVDSSANASYVVDSLNEDNALDVTVNNTGDMDWKGQIKQNNVKLEQGKTYKLSFDAKSSLDRPIRVVMQGQEDKGWEVYSTDPAINLTGSYRTFTETFTMNAETDPAAFLSICLGMVGDHITQTHRVVIDNIRLTEVDAEPEVIPEPDCVLPAGLKTIEQEAFLGCGFRCVRIADGAETIGNRAFAASDALQYIYIPESVSTIDNDAFDAVEGLRVIGVPGSVAQTFAEAKGFAFIVG